MKEVVERVEELAADMETVGRSAMYRGYADHARDLRALLAYVGECREAPTTTPRPEWMDDRNRAPWAVNSVLNRLNEARTAERNCRRAFRKPYMGELATWLAGVYAEVGDLWQARLRELRLGTEDGSHPSQPHDGEVASAQREDTTGLESSARQLEGGG